MASSAKPARIALFALFLSAALLFGIASSAKCDLVAGQECSLTDLSACCSAGLVCDGTAKLCCVPSGSEIRCIKDGDCCSGQCNGVCVSGWACGHACSLSSQCGKDCPMCMDNGQGANVCSSCIANGSLTSCSSDSQCCAGLHCASSTSRCVDCLEEGNTCNTHSDCCSNSCELRQDGSRKCAVFQAPQSCRLQGQYCSASISCCSGIPSPVSLSCDYQNPLPPGGIAGDGACRNCIPETFSCSAGGLSCCKSRDTCKTTVASGGATFCLAPNGAANTTHIFRNWVQVGNASFNLTSLKRSGASAVLMDASASNADSYIYNSKLALKNGSNYLLEFFANGSVRYAIYDAGNDAYLGSGGEWVFSPRNATGYEQPVISDSGFAAGNYSYGRRMFTTLASNVNHVQIRFYPKSGGGRLSLDDVSITELNDFSQFAWIRPETGSNGTIFSQMGAENGSAQGFSWRISGGKTLTLNYSSALGIAGAPASAAAAIELPQDGGWHHVGISVLRRGNYTVYLDGSRYSSGSFANMGRLNSSANFTIGKPQGGVSFNGTLDEVRFYQRALLPQEIADLYSGSKSGKCEITAGFSYGTPGIVASDLSSAYNAQLRIRALPSTTVLSMPFDVNVSSTAMGAIADYSRYGMHGTKLSGAAWSPDGKYGGAYYMGGGASSSIYLCSGCLSNLQYYTATAWVKPDYSGSDTYYAILAADTSSGLNVLLRRSDGRLGAICDSGLAFAPLAVPNNAWTFVAVRGFRNQTGGFIEASVNGGNWTQVCTGTANSFLYDNTAFYIGSKGQATYRAKGTIDEVRVFNTAISPSELQSLYAEGATVYSNRVPAPSLVSSALYTNATNITLPGLTCGATICGQSEYCCNLTDPYTCYDNVSTFCNASTGIDPFGCRDLNESNTIYLLSGNANISGTARSICYNVTAPNVTLDCNGHSILGITGYNSYAVYSNQLKTTVKNCKIEKFDVGIYFNAAMNGTIENNLVNSTLYNFVEPTYSSAILLRNSGFNTLKDNLAYSSGGYSIFIYNSANNTIINSNGTAESYYGIYLLSSSNNTISKSAGIGNTHGILLSSSSNNQLIDSNGMSWGNGIVLSGASNHNAIINSIGTGNIASGISLEFCYNSTLINSNGISTSGFGISLAAGANNIVNYSNGTSNSNYGIYLTGANNTIANAYGTSQSSHGIHITSSLNNTIINFIGTSNSDYGIYTYLSSNSKILNSNGVSNSGGGIHLFQSSNNTIGNTSGSSTSGAGISLYQSSNNTLSNFTATSKTGISLSLSTSSSNNALSNFTATTSIDSILDTIQLYYDSNNNRLSNFKTTEYYGFSSCYSTSVHISSSSNNTLSNFIALDKLWLESNSNNNTISNFTVASDTGRALMFATSSNNNTLSNFTATSVSNNALYISSSSNNQLSNFNATSNSGSGISLSSSFYNRITNAVAISNTSAGISLAGSSNNTITNSTGISNASSGIYFQDNCYNNTIVFSSGISSNFTGIFFYFNCNNNTITSSNGITNSGSGIAFTASGYNTIINSTGTAISGNGMTLQGNQLTINNSNGTGSVNGIILYSSSSSISNCIWTGGSEMGIALSGSNNTLSNFTATSTNYKAFSLSSSSNNNISRGKLISGNKLNTLLSIDSGSQNNRFYWNNFTNTSGLYVEDTSGGLNFYNTTIGGNPEGNIWYNVMNGSVVITGTTNSSYGGGLKIGTGGSGYPYNSTNSKNKVSTGVVDRAPLWK